MTNEQIRKQITKNIPEVKSYYYTSYGLIEGNETIEFPTIIRQLRTTDEDTTEGYNDVLNKHETFQIGILAEFEPDLKGDYEECLENYALSIYYRFKEVFKSYFRFNNISLRWWRREFAGQALVLNFDCINQCSVDCETEIKVCEPLTYDEDKKCICIK
jgi:hypothetical protein